MPSGIFLTHGSNLHLLCLLYCRRILYCWATRYHLLKVTHQLFLYHYKLTDYLVSLKIHCNYYPYWSSKSPIFSQQESHQVVSWVLLTEPKLSVITSSLSDRSRCPMFILYIYWPRCRVSHFSKPWFLLVRNVKYFKTIILMLFLPSWSLFLSFLVLRYSKYLYIQKKNRNS